MADSEPDSPRSVSSLGSLDDVFSDISVNNDDAAAAFNIPRCPALTDICVAAIVKNFAAYPILSSLPRKFQERVVALLPTDLPLSVCAAVVADESYWKRRATERWTLCKVAAHGGSWKQLYFEEHVRAQLETYASDKVPLASLLRNFAIAAPYVRRVEFKQLPSHLDMAMVLLHLGLVDTLDATYGLLDLGMDFQWGLLGTTLTDVRGIAGVLSTSATLRSLSLQSSTVDDEKTRVLAAGLIKAPKLTHLDLSHNAIGDAGARALAKCLATPELELRELLLGNNAIGEAGGQALGHALHVNGSLATLDLRMNRLGDGCAYVCAGATSNSSLVRLSLAANRLDSVQAVVQLRELIRQNSTITDLDISSNRIMSKLGAKLRDGIEHNTTLLKLDIRATEISREAQVAIETALAANLERFRVQTRHYE